MAGEARLEELRKGASDDAKAAWSAARSTSRMQARDLPPATLQAIFKADVKKLPAYAGAVVDGGYTLYRIDKVDVPAQINVEQRKGLQREYGAIRAAGSGGVPHGAAPALQDRHQPCGARASRSKHG